MNAGIFGTDLTGSAGGCGAEPWSGFDEYGSSTDGGGHSEGYDACGEHAGRYQLKRFLDAAGDGNEEPGSDAAYGSERVHPAAGGR